MRRHLVACAGAARRQATSEAFAGRALLDRVRRIQIIPSPPAASAPAPTHPAAGAGPVAHASDSVLPPPAPRTQSKVLRLYEEYERQFPAHLVLIQVGDFFEIFGAAAEQASRVLEIGLCRGSRYATPMTGFPVRSMDTYLERLVRAGISSVVCEQYQEGSAIGRRITRIITPGTLTEEGLLERGANNFILAVGLRGGCGAHVGLAWIDLSTGFFRVSEAPRRELWDELARINPIEVVAGDGLHADPDLQRFLAGGRATLAKTKAVGGVAEGEGEGKAAFAEVFAGVFGRSHDWGWLSELEGRAGADLLGYILKTQLDKRPYIEHPSRHNRSSSMHLDASALKSLEILRNNTSGMRENSLLEAVDLTCTAPGSRLLLLRLQSPLVDVALIEERLEAVQFFFDRPQLVAQLRAGLKQCRDLERCFQRLALNRSTGGPRDMLAIQQTLGEALSMQSILAPLQHAVPQRLLAHFCDCSPIVARLGAALVDSPPHRVSDGGLIREGYSERLDQVRGGASLIESRRNSLLEKYRAQTGMASLPGRSRVGRARLRLSTRKTLGWLVEISKADGEIADPRFVLDSQVENKLRYRTSELEELNRTFSSSGEEALRVEAELYEELRGAVVGGAGGGIVSTAKIIAELDVVTSQALLARKRSYTRPRVEDSSVFRIVGGRHPVVEAKHADLGRSFVHNDCDLGAAQRFALITGPNMGGKSTFLRQNALIAVMAQCGMFVPAGSATIGLVDAVHTRIGASDDVSRDRSTFMVEMSETAGILRRATPRSLVIMDEIGRGTAAEEGFALAKGICQYLYEKGARTLFATHYARLEQLVRGFASSQCLMTSARMEGDTLVFLHHLTEGVAARSHAVEIARLAGVPESVLRAALHEDGGGGGGEAEAVQRLERVIEAVRGAEGGRGPKALRAKECREILDRVRAALRVPAAQ